MLENEADRYRRSAAAIERSGMKTIASGGVTTCWVFADFAEMVEHIFGFFGRPPGGAGRDRMAGILGARRAEAPLDIEDATRYWLLEPGTGGRRA